MTYVFRTTAEVGWAVRGDFESELRNQCFLRGVELRLEEDKGLLSSTFRLELLGEKEEVQKIIVVLKDLET